ncbi:hypothetical protein, partial [uncultured Helicobacter sp.]|uniref:hypothetical protein n=2 Tax=uncultured Helicobacter sp. TaxID=175537 RepID=UPI0026031B43
MYKRIKIMQNFALITLIEFLYSLHSMVFSAPILWHKTTRQGFQILLFCKMGNIERIYSLQDVEINTAHLAQ